jgi:putative addiction module component (TIGR02574 family)
MERKNREVFAAAVALPEGQRIRLIKRLLDTLADPEEFWEDQLATELNRRHAEIKAGTAKPIPWSELKNEL